MNIPQMASLWIAPAAALNLPASLRWRHDKDLIGIAAELNKASTSVASATVFEVEK